MKLLFKFSLPVSLEYRVSIQVVEETYSLLGESDKEKLKALMGFSTDEEGRRNHKGVFKRSVFASDPPSSWEIYVSKKGGGATVCHEWGHAVWDVVRWNHLPFRVQIRASELLDKFEEWWGREGAVLGRYACTSLEEGWAEAVRHYFVYQAEKGPEGVGCLLKFQRESELDGGVFEDEWYEGIEIVAEALNWIVKQE